MSIYLFTATRQKPFERGGRIATHRHTVHLVERIVPNSPITHSRDARRFRWICTESFHRGRKTREKSNANLLKSRWVGIVISTRLTDDADDFRLCDTLGKIGHNGMARHSHVTARGANGGRQVRGRNPSAVGRRGNARSIFAHFPPVQYPRDSRRWITVGRRTFKRHRIVHFGLAGPRDCHRFRPDCSCKERKVDKNGSIHRTPFCQANITMCNNNNKLIGRHPSFVVLCQPPPSSIDQTLSGSLFHYRRSCRRPSSCDGSTGKTITK